MSPRDWDAVSYDRLAAPMTRWGRAVVGRLDLQGDERVLDAGCGTGKVTAMLRERLPDGEIVALVASASMMALARERLGDDRVTYVVADLQEPLPVEPSVDAVLSTATFHWILDHDRLVPQPRLGDAPRRTAGGAVRRQGQRRLGGGCAA